MEINPAHFTQTLLPSERISFLKHLKRFDKGLLNLLHTELKNGNKILSVYTDANGETVIVNLSGSFFNDYAEEGHQLEVSTDAHYGGASYFGKIFTSHKLTAPIGRGTGL